MPSYLASGLSTVDRDTPQQNKDGPSAWFREDEAMASQQIQLHCVKIPFKETIYFPNDSGCGLDLNPNSPICEFLTGKPSHGILL